MYERLLSRSLPQLRSPASIHDGRMNQKLWSGFTAATLLVTTLAIAPSSYANQLGSVDEGSEAQVPAEEPSPDRVVSTTSPEAPTSAEEFSGQDVSTSPPPTPAVDAIPEESPSQDISTSPTPVPAENTTPEWSESTPDPAVSPTPESSNEVEVVKVGEYQSQEQAEPDTTITAIHPHEVEGRQAVTLYVRNIPVLTFVGSDSAPSSISPSPADSVESTASNHSRSVDVKVAGVSDSTTEYSTEAPAAQSDRDAGGEAGTVNANETIDPNDPIWRATTIAARLNQLYRDNVDANSITVAWVPDRRRYVIRVGDEELVEMDAATILPHSTDDPAADALEATNLIRRQLGNAPPLQDISGDPESGSTISLGSIEFSITGYASWYGPGFDGNYSASGEIFDQNALTAAHPSLPFGTQVRVTNLDTGLSVVVRINDRGPYAGDRVIDLSAAAAQAIGMLYTGVAPVNVEVLDTHSSGSSSE
ncbi:MAG: septal ring lytic transglycosylase RlpA family protein [Cyanobacteria bacterium CRU_2_1]|nr:septal ring lytic transglycosylase RlpA family protein [Cyanobacteria bacterium RU_5_0]NJR60736.1 septal ring lytic transglycosylase RlpA family protein [Cyanobacteria bacterium CRU_2_1]